MSHARFAVAALVAGLGFAAPAAAYTINSDVGYDGLRLDGYGSFGLNLLNDDATGAFASGDVDLFSALTGAATTLSGLISGYINESFAHYIENSAFPGLPAPGYDIVVQVLELDGAGNTLAQAGGLTAVTDFDFVMPTYGVMQIDAADLTLMKTNNILEDVMLHEMMHALGFGGFYWSANGVLASAGEYIGASGLSAYEMEYVPGASFIPLEDTGGSGTAGSHWDQEFFGDNAGGSTYDEELMTGFIGTSSFLSQTSIFSLQDIGYALGDTVAALNAGPLYYYEPPVSAVPVPAAGGLLASALLGLGVVRRRRRAA
ncbi:leishmanolysin-related zinc metalloendopeptidase [uncultured Albimonas sp.]|uniref:leishmanolysin-related zinc metalloendopeptidase n=1 Tax=uncultured Albimonas sp. TaxID=1331701 RepID=UPI0030EE0892